MIWYIPKSGVRAHMHLQPNLDEGKRAAAPKNNASSQEMTENGKPAIMCLLSSFAVIASQFLRLISSQIMPNDVKTRNDLPLQVQSFHSFSFPSA